MDSTAPLPKFLDPVANVIDRLSTLNLENAQLKERIRELESQIETLEEEACHPV